MIHDILLFLAGDEEEEELDEATRQYNFWTHQVHIFFVRKFFPAAQHFAVIKQILHEKYSAVDAAAATAESQEGSDRPTSTAPADKAPTPVVANELEVENPHMIDITEATESIKTES